VPAYELCCSRFDFGKPRLTIERVFGGLPDSPRHLRVLRASLLICVKTLLALPRYKATP